MNVTQTQTERRTAMNLKTPLVAFLLLATLVWLVQITAPYSQGWPLLWDTVFHYDAANYQHLITHLTYLPRLAIAVICGFALAIAGCVMQFVLRNPIASPTTLGVRPYYHSQLPPYTHQVKVRGKPVVPANNMV